MVASAARVEPNRSDLCKRIRSSSIISVPGSAVTKRASGVSSGILVHRPTGVRISLALSRLRRFAKPAGIVEWCMFLVLTREFQLSTTIRLGRFHLNTFASTDSESHGCCSWQRPIISILHFRIFASERIQSLNCLTAARRKVFGAPTR